MNALPQLVDPFIPQRPRPIPTGQYGSQWLRHTTAHTAQPVRKAQAPNKHGSIQRFTPKTAPTRTKRPAISDFITTQPDPPIQTKLTTNSTLTQTPHITNTQPAHSATTKAYAMPHPVTQEKSQPRLLIRILRRVQIPLIVILAIIGGQLMTTLAFGEIAIGVYAIFALVRHVASSITFLLAFITLIAITVLEAAGKNGTLATYFAIYAFLLLVVGTISLSAEIRDRY